jgi:hypothetical protein
MPLRRNPVPLGAVALTVREDKVVAQIKLVEVLMSFLPIPRPVRDEVPHAAPRIRHVARFSAGGFAIRVCSRMWHAGAHYARLLGTVAAPAVIARGWQVVRIDTYGRADKSPSWGQRAAGPVGLSCGPSVLLRLHQDPVPAGLGHHPAFQFTGFGSFPGSKPPLHFLVRRRDGRQVSGVP